MPPGCILPSVRLTLDLLQAVWDLVQEKTPGREVMLGVGNYTVCLDTVVYASIHVGEHCLSNQGDYKDITFVVYE